LPEPAAAPEQPWRLLARRELGASARATFCANTYALPDGSTRQDYFVVEERGGAVVVALTEDEEVVLVGQYRAPVQTFAWELPAGALEADESDACVRAQTELRQETGFEAREWHDVGVLLPAPHRSSETDRCFLALGARRTDRQDLDPGESVRVRVVALDEVERMIDRGEIGSGVSIAALHRALRLRARLRQPTRAGSQRRGG
jgi:ADP-ribose pyrophosphatase